MRLVGLDPDALERFPHQFSGGQRQRICIARALAMEPEILIADEAVSALDVSVQAQVLELIDDVRKRFNLAVLFITHDLRVAAQVCDRIAVMHKGEVVEEGPTAAVFARAEARLYPGAVRCSARAQFRFGKFERNESVSRGAGYAARHRWCAPKRDARERLGVAGSRDFRARCARDAIYFPAILP